MNRLAEASVPQGEPLTLAHARWLAPRIAARIEGLGAQALADLSFANLWLFRRAHDYRLLDSDWPVIQGRTYDGRSHLLPLFALAQAPHAALQTLLAGHDCFFPLSTQEVATLDASRFSVHSERNDADYLYDADTFRHYSGPLLHSKRNLLNQCLKLHRLRVEPYTPVLQAPALQVLRAWLQEKGKQPDEADDLPCQEALALAPQLGLEGFMVWADGAPAGFLLAEESQPGVFVMRFAKGLAQFKGLSQFLFHHFATRFERPVHWMNFEQDLGLANFRRTKLSYQPRALLPKLRVRLRTHLAQP